MPADLAPASDPSTRITEPPAPVARWRSPRWLPLVAAGGLGLLAGVLLDRDPPRPPQAPPTPAAAALVPEIPLPPVEARAPPAVADPRVADPRLPARERAAPAAAAPSPEAAPRPLRKLRRRVASADAAAAGRAKLQIGDESLKQGHFFEALMAFREALDQDPPLPAAARRLGDAYRAHQDHELAVAAYERYLELDPAAPDADEVRAVVEQLRSGTPLAR
jgi:Tetratricopeptide repeat